MKGVIILKRVFCFLSLLLSLCILFPVFLISPSAAEIDGNTIYTYWYADDPLDLVVFDNIIITRSKPSDFYIIINVILSNPIKKHTTFDVDLSFLADSFSSNSVDVSFFDDNTKLVDTVSTEIVNNKISISTLQFDSVISKIHYKIHVSNANWSVIETLHDFTIDDSLYHCEDFQTWSAWCNSSYNTLGLFVDNGHIYKGDALNLYILKLGDTSVSSSDYVNKDTNYILSPAGVVATTFNFYIGSTKYISESGMTWKDWLSSPYNTSGFITDGDYIYNSDMTKILVNGGFLVDVEASIINNGRYALSDYTIGDETYALYQYEFNFSVNSLDIVIHDEGDLLNGILSWVKKIVNSLNDFPNKIGQVISDKLNLFGDWLVDKIKGLFVPTQEEIEDIIERFEALLEDRFGIAYDANKIIDDFAAAFTYSEGRSKISFPSVTVNLAGVDFTFGGWEVDLIPEGFEGLAESLKFIVNIVCSFVYLMAIRRRWEEVIR